jgi:dienelactone hydrolase
LVKTLEKKDDQIVTLLQWISLPSMRTVTIWSDSSEEVSSFDFDAGGNQAAFIIEKKKGDQSVYQLWYYGQDMDRAVMLANDQTPGVGDALDIANQTPKFSADGRRIFFGLRSVYGVKQRSMPDVDIWSYTDPELQSLQVEELKNRPIYTSVIAVGEKEVVRLEHKDEKIIGYGYGFVLMEHVLGNMSIFEGYWNLAARVSVYIVSTEDGSRKLLKANISSYAGLLSLSPAGRWVIYYDIRQRNYFSYEVGTGRTQNITKGAFTSWTVEPRDQPEPLLAGGQHWIGKDEAVLIGDNYDIWQVDPSGKRQPLNLTNGFGVKHHIKFELLNEPMVLEALSMKQKPTLVLKAVNTLTKDQGFYNKRLETLGDPEYCSMGPYVYGNWNGYHTVNSRPLKAKTADIYLIIRMSAMESPNYFATRDFKYFVSLSSVHPETEYNWLTTTLVHWKSFDGVGLKGILYKPQNFDANKKYPIIFDYYEKRSDELNLYIRPEAAENRINIPWFVSRGYLVFAPDIDYKIGEPGPSAYNAIVSAAKYLTKFPWVNARAMGIQGHSFGGYETDYLVSHSDLFAAACSASGFCDLISWYGSAVRGEYPMYHAERSQGRIGATPWQRPDLYVNNSPIFKADKVNAPLLMMQNKNDDVVSFAQGLEFFTALRRLGKRVWMLQYDSGRHSVGEEAAEDFNTRMTQFFDHYLKGALAPTWMTRGVPAGKRGVDDGLDLDDEIKTPGPGLNLRIPNAQQ